ncbi:HD domain-containing protein [Streptomyces pinistramenti]|uniref:HD domain-containing protein n=1 Tax=Streptomyces pinistramenti TaxID=2884812 RepID=UPI001D0708C6|nr:HD domain-containing protein [Streptomyces pinistramenti]MCB5911915.1 HD domain-containing protein [Streptomyces pinistramenti]
MTPGETQVTVGLKAVTAPPELIPALPEGPLARRALHLVIREESAAIAHHSIRSALFARLLADHRGAEPGRDYDPELLFLACVLHDIGLTERGNGRQRFEVDGADAAAAFLAEQNLPAGQVDAVWEAIALHTSPGIAERRGTLCALVRAGVGMDFGRAADFVSDATGAAIHAAYPRLSMTTSLVDEIVAQAAARPEKAPRYSLAGELLRERTTPPYRAALEERTAAARWGN